MIASPVRRAIVVLALCVVARPVSADVVAPLLPQGAAEIGVRWRNVDRTLEYEGLDRDVDRSDVAVAIRYGITGNATLAAELMTAPGQLTSEEDIERYYLLGASLRTLVWRDDRIAVSTGFHYQSSFWRRESPEGCDQESQIIDWELLVEWDTGLESQEVILWGGPMVSHFSLSDEPPCDNDYWAPSRILGGTVGASALLFQHLKIDGQLVWIENPEPRLGVSYRF